MEFVLVIWGSVVLGVFAWAVDDMRQRIKQLQATLEKFIEDVQE